MYTDAVTFFVVAALLVKKCHAWVLTTPRYHQSYNNRQHEHPRTKNSFLHLVPIREFRDDFSFLSTSDDNRCGLDTNGRFNNTEYELCVVEEDDLMDTARFVLLCFGVDPIRLSSQLNSYERVIMKPVTELLNGYSGVVAFAEILGGLRSRVRTRIKDKTGIDRPRQQEQKRSSPLDVQDNLVEGEALVLVLAKRNNDSKSIWKTEIAGSVELRLQPCDGKVPFSLPGLDRLERWLASLVGLSKSRKFRPYLSNLCVSEECRGKGMGRALVRVVEDIASTTWRYSRLYLHVDTDNEAAYNLYKSEGYKDVGLRWRPFWAGKASDIGYYSKKLPRQS